VSAEGSCSQAWREETRQAWHLESRGAVAAAVGDEQVGLVAASEME
jgi:hypothetical protein